MLGRGTRAGRDGFISALLFLVDEDMFVYPREVDSVIVSEADRVLGDATRDFNCDRYFFNTAAVGNFGQH